MAFALSPSGKALGSMAAIRNAVFGCTSASGHSYHSPQYYRIKHRDVPAGSFSTFEDDVPIYPNHEFHRTSLMWRKERARLAGYLRRLSQLLCSVEWEHSGHHSSSFPIRSRLDPDLVELNIRRMMGDAAFSKSEAARLNRLLTHWESTVFRIHVRQADFFVETDCPWMAVPSTAMLAPGYYSEDVCTAMSTECVLSDEYDSDHMRAKQGLPYFPQDGNPGLVARFLSHVQDEIRYAAELVMLNTEQQQLRWQPIVRQTHPAYRATIQLAKRRYYSRLARVFAKRLLKRQILHYQGRKPMDKQQLGKDASGSLYSPSDDFKYTLLERSLGLTYSQILVVLIKNIHFVMHDLDAQAAMEPARRVRRRRGADFSATV
jgi:hypothetical protein